MKRSEMGCLSENIDLQYLLGILNPKYASYLLSDIRGGDYHIVPEHIRNIPIPYVEKEQQAPIVLLVDKILEAKKADPTADTSVLKSQIDQMVYAIYNLTAEEIEIIENK